MLATVQSWIETNPSRNTSVIPIEIRTISDTSDDYQVINGPGGCVLTPLDPPCPVSFYLWHSDPLYRVGTLKLRKQILMEKIVELAKRIEEDCRGHRWQRKKILEQLSAQQSAAVSPQQDTPELDEALCFVLGFQKMILDDIHKRVLPFPKDFRSWSKELPVWTTALGSRCIFHLPGERSLGEGLGTWILDREKEGWKLHWPADLDLKLDAVKTRCVAANIKPTVEKPKKEDWCNILGRYDTITHLLTHFH